MKNDAYKKIAIINRAIPTYLFEENPDLTYSLIKEILIGIEELEQGEKSEYKFDKIMKLGTAPV